MSPAPEHALSFSCVALLYFLFIIQQLKIWNLSVIIKNLRNINTLKKIVLCKNKFFL